MTTENNKRDIPPMPGGGSWTFDETTWSWIDNHAAPVASTEPSNNEFHAEE